MINTERLPEFNHDLKKLLKRFSTLEEDLGVFINASIRSYHEIGKDNDGIFEIPGFETEEPKIYKAKKFACKALKGKGVQSGIRVIYAFYAESRSVVFIEIYIKGDKVNEDRERIKKFLKGIKGKK